MALPEKPTAPSPARIRPRRRVCARISAVGENALTPPILRSPRRAVFALSGFAQPKQLALRAIDVRFALILQALVILAHEFFDLGGRHRGAAKEALILIAAHAPQYAELFLRLHTLRDHLQPQSMRQRDDRAHNRGIAGVCCDIADETAIDLELVDGESL